LRGSRIGAERVRCDKTGRLVRIRLSVWSVCARVRECERLRDRRGRGRYLDARLGQLRHVGSDLGERPSPHQSGNRGDVSVQDAVGLPNMSM